jgi:hypothetical protein
MSLSWRDLESLHTELSHDRGDMNGRMQNQDGGRIRSLFAIWILRLSGTPEAVFESIGKHNQTRWIAEQAREAAEK